MSAGAPPLKLDSSVVALAARHFRTATVVESPAAAAETIIASLTIDADLVVTQGVALRAFCAYTVGTDGVSGNLRIRKTDVAGSVLKATGALTVVAAQLHAPNILAFDTAPTLPNQVYVLTLVVASGSAASTVSAVELDALVI